MTEVFIAVADALARSVVRAELVRVEGRRDLPRPFYLPAPPRQTPAQYGAALAKLGKLGLVRSS